MLKIKSFSCIQDKGRSALKKVEHDSWILLPYLLKKPEFSSKEGYKQEVRKFINLQANAAKRIRRKIWIIRQSRNKLS